MVRVSETVARKRFEMDDPRCLKELRALGAKEARHREEPQDTRNSLTTASVRCTEGALIHGFPRIASPMRLNGVQGVAGSNPAVPTNNDNGVHDRGLNSVTTFEPTCHRFEPLLCPSGHHDRKHRLRIGCRVAALERAPVLPAR